MASLRVVIAAATGQALSTRRRRPTVPQVVTLIAGKCRSLLMAGDDDQMFMTRSLNVTSKTTEQHLIARSDKSVAYVFFSVLSYVLSCVLNEYVMLRN